MTPNAPPSSRTSIQVPRERLFQLQELAEHYKLTISETIGELIRQQVQIGLISHNIPGITINSASDGMMIRFEGGKPVTMGLEGIIALANTIRSFVEAEGRSEKRVNTDHNFAVERRGTSIKVSIPATRGTERTFSKDVARDFATMIEKALPA